MPDGWTRVQGGTPQKGDILVYRGVTGVEGASEVGHVAIYESDYSHYHQNFSGQYVERVTYKYNGLKNPYWGYIRPNWQPERFNYSIDELKNTKDGLYIKGWAYDKRSTSSQAKIHVYVGGPANGGGEGHNLGATAVARTDVNNTFGISGNHGFDKSFTTVLTGTQTVYIYALSQDETYNELLTTRTLVVGNQPTGALDKVKSTCSGVIYVRGWAYDPDNTGASNTVHIYVGDAAGSGGEGHTKDVNDTYITAEKYRADVHNTYHCGNYHGFEAYIPTKKTGTQRVYAYGINLGNGSNAAIGNLAVTISTASHTFNSGVITKPATCTAAGQKTVTCTKCGYKSTASVPATGHQHTEIRNSSPATCTSPGYTGDNYCKDCNALLSKGKEIPAFGHDWDEGVITKTPTVDAEGEKTYTCKNCGEKKKEVLPKENAPAPDQKEDSTSTETPTDVNKPEEPETATGSDAYVPKGTPSVRKGEKAIAVLADTGDVKGSTFGKLRARASKSTKTSIKLQWNKVAGANGYIIYGNRCGKSYKYKKLKTVSGSSWTQTKLKKGTYYKYIIAAYRNTSEGQYMIVTSKSIHAITKGNKKYTVAKSLKLNKTKVTLKKGKKFKLKAKEIPLVKKKIQHHRNIAFESSNPNIAAVNAKGKITGKKKGSCNIYVYAQNGIYKIVKVKVK